jgi:nucleotide-binding universal stress UspA family protein
MTTFKRILCPVDFSDSSWRALEEAVWWTREYERGNPGADHGTLCLLHVLPPVYLPGSDSAAWDGDFLERDQALQKLQEIGKTRVPPEIQRCLYPVVQRGNPADEIIEAVADDKYDLIVMATHGLTGWRHLVLGSVAEAVVRQASSPVLTVRARPDEGSHKHRGVKKVLCPTDFSGPSYTAFPIAGELASRSEAQLQIIHVMEPLSPVLGIVSAEEFEQARSSEAAQALLEVIESHLPREIQGVAALNRLVRTGGAAEQIVRAAEEEHVDLIVIATHGETGWWHLMFGSVAEEVVRTAPCPVMTICAPEAIAARPAAKH